MAQSIVTATFGDFDEQSRTPSSPQSQLRPEPLTIRMLIQERARYFTPPPYQRQKVWRPGWRKQLIDTILRGDPIGRMEGHEVTDAKGQTTWVLDDGYQRLSTIIDFVDGKFRTMSVTEKSSGPLGLAELPVEPRRLFSQLSPAARDCFLNYQFYIDRTRAMTEEQRLERFLRIQNQAPLVSGEILGIFNSKAKHGAMQIQNHVYWSKAYRGERSRGQLFRACLYVLALETAKSGFLNLRGAPKIKEIAAGKYDHLVTENLLNEISLRLDVAAHIFDGLVFPEVSVLVACYQAVMFLERSGYGVKKWRQREIDTMDG